MLILIAESKTMTQCDVEQTPESLVAHTPCGEGVAASVMAAIASMSVPELAAAAGFSPTMASREQRLAYEFPDKRLGQTAIEAYTGVVFKALDYESLTDEAQSRVTADVRIISSLYGWLHPDDIIKPYRLDFTTPLAPGDISFSTYWRKAVTIALVRELKERGQCDLINLLPADAAKCIDWKLVKSFARVWKIDFKEMKDGGSYATPHAGKLKTLRGGLLRQIVSQGILSARELMTLTTDDLLPLGTPDYPSHIAFCV